MFWTVFAIKKMNTWHLFMISINIPPCVQSVSGRQALYDLGQGLIDRSGGTTEQFFEIIAFDIQRTFTDAFLDSEQDRDAEIRYVGTAHRFGISGIIELQYGELFLQNRSKSRRDFFLSQRLAGELIDCVFVSGAGQHGSRSFRIILLQRPTDLAVACGCHPRTPWMLETSFSKY
jgi:hypothetical protein